MFAGTSTDLEHGKCWNCSKAKINKQRGNQREGLTYRQEHDGSALSHVLSKLYGRQQRNRNNWCWWNDADRKIYSEQRQWSQTHIFDFDNVFKQVGEFFSWLITAQLTARRSFFEGHSNLSKVMTLILLSKQSRNSDHFRSFVAEMRLYFTCKKTLHRKQSEFSKRESKVFVVVPPTSSQTSCHAFKKTGSADVKELVYSSSACSMQ